MTAQMAPKDGQWVVTCAEHDWRFQVATEGHALNLLRKHNREWVHTQAPDGTPATIDLTAAAQYLLTCHADQDTDGPPDLAPFATAAAGAYFAALDMWQALTGLADEAALSYARTVAARQTTAVLAPF